MRQFAGEVLRIADAEDPAARVMAQAPGRKGDRGQMRLNGFLIPTGYSLKLSKREFFAVAHSGASTRARLPVALDNILRARELSAPDRPPYGYKLTAEEISALEGVID